MNEKEQLYEKLEDLRARVQNNPKAMEYYAKLKEMNLNDQLYGWEFSNDAILNDTLDDLNLYQDAYVRDVLRVYVSELETILYKMEV